MLTNREQLALFRSACVCPIPPSKISTDPRFTDEFYESDEDFDDDIILDDYYPDPHYSIPDPDPDLTEKFPDYSPPKGPPGHTIPTPPRDIPIPPDLVDPPPDEPPPQTQPNDPDPTQGCSGPLPTGCSSFHPEATVPGRLSQAATIRAITSYVNSKGYRHDPDGIPWINRSAWIEWDGIPINPCTSTTKQLMAFIFPKPGGVHTMRGLRELFYQKNPFADNSNPTVREIEDWNIEVIRHFRRLLGFNQTTHPVFNDKCTYNRAAWAEERARSNHWTTKYPSGNLDGGSGPCTIPFSSNAHCGAAFIPDDVDQIPYKCPADMNTCVGGGAEGVQNINTDIPWSIKMGRIIGTFLNSDGIGAHTGPFIGRTCFGSAWYMNGGNTVFRGKWSGPLVPTCN